MVKRIITGACYVAVVVGFFLLKFFWRAVAFDALLWFFCAFGTFELVRATKGFAMPCGFWTGIVSGALLPAGYVIAEYFLKKWIALYIVLGAAVALALALLIVKFITKDTIKRWGVTILSIFYPFLGVLAMMILNDVNGKAGITGLLLVFVIPALSDTFAYFVGVIYNTIKKGNAKRIFPTVSPNKTYAGAIGALFGGALGGFLVYVIFKPKPRIAAPMLIFTFIGLVASIVNMFGDLFESYIKRKVGIKDMGNIMPGHGGVLDRIDGMVFTSIYILLMMFLM